MFRIRGLVASITMTALALCWASTAQAQTTLRYQFKKGEKLNYALEQKMNMKMTVNNMDVQMEMVQNLDIDWNVLAVENDGSAQIKQKFERLRMKMNTPQGAIEYDSKDGQLPNNPIGQAMGKALATMVGAEVTVTMSPRGVLSNVKLSDKFKESLKNLAAGAPGMGDMFSEDGLKRMFNQSGLTLPEKAVKKGDTWDQSLNVKLPFGKMAAKYTMTYKGPAKRDNRAVEQVDLKIVSATEPDPNSPIKLTIQADDSKGTAYFDNTAGRLLATTINQNMTMQVEVGGMTINQVLRQDILFKLVEKK